MGAIEEQRQPLDGLRRRAVLLPLETLELGWRLALVLQLAEQLELEQRLEQMPILEQEPRLEIAEQTIAEVAFVVEQSMAIVIAEGIIAVGTISSSRTTLDFEQWPSHFHIGQ